MKSVGVGCSCGVRTRAVAAQGEAEALFGTVGNAKTITLNRPKALNALSMNMVRLIRPQVDEWCSAAPDITSTAVITKGAGEKAFCGMFGDASRLRRLAPCLTPHTTFHSGW